MANISKSKLNKLKKQNLEISELNLNPRFDHILSNYSSFAVAEAYRSARSNLQFASNEDGCNIIAVTSSIPSEGKTISCTNLAISLAQSGKRVLLIDADMRKPQVASGLGLKQSPGLSEMLAGFVKISDNDINFCRQKLPNISGIDIIASGKTPPNPAELLGGKRFPAILDILSSEYDFIMIDTPPVLIVTDAIVIKPHINGYIIVTRANVSRMDVVKETVGKLRQVEAKICGFIFNGKKNKMGTKYGKYSRYGYDAYKYDEKF